MVQDVMLYGWAVVLGALHAFEPGHGKTIIAAYMIGSRGRAVDGILLGLVVTFTHTFSVIILGIIARLLSHNYTEQQLHGWLGLFSALLILAVGLWLLYQRLLGGKHGHLHLFGHVHHHHTAHGHGEEMPRAAAHTHAHGADHDGHDHGHVHDHHAHTHGPGHDHGPSPGPAQAAPGPVPASGHDTWNLLLLGISGGLVPCPAGIATLLAAVAAGRIAQGLTVVIFFSLGLGLVMMAIGVVLSQAGRLASRIDSNQEFGRRIAILSAFIITGLGAVTLFHSVKTLWF